MNIKAPKQKQLSKESLYELQLIDCNCNDCKFLERDLSKQSKGVNYGKCLKKNIDVSFMPGICQLETQDCFIHRKNN